MISWRFFDQTRVTVTFTSRMWTDWRRTRTWRWLLAFDCSFRFSSNVTAWQLLFQFFGGVFKMSQILSIQLQGNWYMDEVKASPGEIQISLMLSALMPARTFHNPKSTDTSKNKVKLFSSTCCTLIFVLRNSLIIFSRNNTFFSRSSTFSSSLRFLTRKLEMWSCLLVISRMSALVSLMSMF